MAEAPTLISALKERSLKGAQITSSDVVSLKTALYESRIPYFFDVCVWDHIKNEDFRNNIIRDGKVIYKH